MWKTSILRKELKQMLTLEAKKDVNLLETNSYRWQMSGLLETCGDALVKKWESESKEELRRYNEEECSRIDKVKAMGRNWEHYKETAGKREF